MAAFQGRTGPRRLVTLSPEAGMRASGRSGPAHEEAPSPGKDQVPDRSTTMPPCSWNTQGRDHGMPRESAQLFQQAPFQPGESDSQTPLVKNSGPTLVPVPTAAYTDGGGDATCDYGAARTATGAPSPLVENVVSARPRHPNEKVTEAPGCVDATTAETGRQIKERRRTKRQPGRNGRKCTQCDEALGCYVFRGEHFYLGRQPPDSPATIDIRGYNSGTASGSGFRGQHNFFHGQQPVYPYSPHSTRQEGYGSSGDGPGPTEPAQGLLSTKGSKGDATAGPGGEATPCHRRHYDIDDNDSVYLLSLGERLNRLGPEKKSLALVKIQELVHCIEFGLELR